MAGSRVVLQRLYADAVWLQQLVVEELRPRPGRIRTAVRMAFIAAVGAALTAALHIDGALGPVTLWVALYASSSRMTASEGLIMLVTYAVTLSASVFLAGILVDVAVAAAAVLWAGDGAHDVRSEQTTTCWRMVQCRGRISRYVLPLRL
jgi:hypothetical protein